MSAIATAIIGGAVIGAGVGIYSSNQQASASESAAQTAAGAQNNAAQLQYNMFEQQLNQPQNVALQKAAPGAINTLSGGYTMNQFQNSPAYQSMLGANQLLMQNAPAQYAASGMLGSGNMQSGLQQQAQLNALQAEGQGYSQWYQPLSAIAGLGQAQAFGNQQMASQTGQSMGNNIVGAGNALAAGQVGAANAWSNGLSNAGSSINSGIMNYLMYSNMNSGGGYGGGIDYTGMGSLNYDPAAALY